MVLAALPPRGSKGLKDVYAMDVPFLRASHRRVSHRVPRIGVHSMGVPLIDVHLVVFLISVYSMGVPLIGVSLMPSIRHILPPPLTPLTPLVLSLDCD
jgi:hypothetical protein